MKKTLILFLFPLLCFSQNEKVVDSLKAVIASKIPIEDKLEAYDDIFNIYLYSNPSIAKSYMNILYKLNKEGKCEECKNYADLENGNYHNSQMDFKTAIKYYEICAKNSLESKDYEMYETAIMQKISTTINSDKLANVEDDINSLLATKKRYNLTKDYEYVYFLSAMTNTAKEYNQTALKYYIMCEEIMDKNNSVDYPFRINVNNMIAIVYTNLGNHEKARKYIDNSLMYAKKSNDLQLKMLAYQNKGFTESSAGNYKGAISYFLEAYNFFTKNNVVIFADQIGQSLGKCYLRIGNYETALFYFNKIIDSYNTQKGKETYTKALVGRAEIYLHFNEIEKAKVDIQKAKDLNKENKVSSYYVNILDIEFKYLKKSGQYENALKTLSYKDSLNTVLQNKTDLINLNEVETKYQTEKKEQQIKLLSAQNELAQKQKYLYIGLLGILVLVGGSLFYGYRNKIKTAHKLNELNELKSRFFANISHEFRTPLTLIKSPVQSLQNEITDENQKSKLQLINTNSSRMLELVDQLLELSKVDSGNLKLILKDGNISSFLHSIVQPFQFQAKEKEITFNSNIQKTNENNAFDKDVIEKIVTNLVTNAFKYSPQNESILFRSTVENSNLKLIISNTGSDVKKEDLPKFFERFYQKNELKQGVGIGLALVKELVELYKGTIATSLENDELSFIVNLPLAVANENAVVIPSKLASPTIENSMVSETELPILLIVDDNVEIRSVLKDIFKNEYQILEAQDGEEAIELAQKEIPDCVISDVMMPKMDGFEFTKQIKSNELTSFIPVILLTAKTSDEAHLEGLKSTADAFLTKPFNNEIVKATVQQLIAERKKLHQRYSQELVLRPVDIVINSVDEKFIEKLQVILDKELSNSDFSSEDFASAVGMSRMQLHRKLKSLLGVTSTEFLRNERLKVATELLKKGNGNISDVAYAVGFNDLSYFSKCFKEMYQCTPSEYMEK